MQEWAAAEIDKSVFLDERHGQRLVTILESLEMGAEQGIPQASRSKAEMHGTYRFFGNERIKPAEILRSHQGSTLERMRGQEIVLAIQDTTDIDYSGLKGTTGLGATCQVAGCRGIKVQTCLAVGGDGEPVGVLHQQTWVRPVKGEIESEEQAKSKEELKARKSRRKIEDKESYRWIEVMEAVEGVVDESIHVVHVADREADIFDVFARERPENHDLLIRAAQNRKVKGEADKLFGVLEQAPVVGQKTLTLERNPRRPSREAVLQVRTARVTLEVPQSHPERLSRQPVCLHGLLVEEENPPSPESGVRWVLLTTLPLETEEQAWEIVRWYSLRWQIERFHYTLKSGLGVEKLQLETANRLLRALATYSIVAWRLMALTYAVRLTPEAPAQTVLSSQEIQLLQRKFDLRRRSRKPPTLREAMIWVARLGGFLARKGDGLPGLKTLWRGMVVLGHLCEGADLTVDGFV
jgi:IS4 transposase